MASDHLTPMVKYTEEPTLQERRGVAEEIRDGIIGSLADIYATLKVAMEPPQVVSSGWKQPSGDVAENLQDLQDAAALAAQNAQASPSFAMPSHATFTINPILPELSRKVSRLAWLLGLSDAERSFVDAAATAAVSGDLPVTYETLMVFADWLDDQGRVKDGVKIRRLVPGNGDVIQLTYRDDISKKDAAEAAKRLGVALRQHLSVMGRDVLLVAGPVGWELQQLPEDDMRRLGWVRLDESIELSRELYRQPEDDGSGSLICTKLLAMIRRPKAESAQHQQAIADAVQKEREACAKLCENYAYNDNPSDNEAFAKIIRARDV